MENEVTDKKEIKGCKPLLTPDDLAKLSGRPRRAIMRLLKSGALRGIKFGGNSWRVRQEDWDAFLATGATGFRYADPSGVRRSRRIKKTGPSAGAGLSPCGHASDCAVHNGPAIAAGPCDCGHSADQR